MIPTWQERAGVKPEPVYCGCGDQIMPDDNARCGTCVMVAGFAQQAAPEQATDLRTRLCRALVDCTHKISDERVAVYFEAKEPGRNAMSQLMDRLVAAAGPSPQQRDESKDAIREKVARAICIACDERPNHTGDAIGNEFRWQDYLDIADSAIAAQERTS